MVPHKNASMIIACLACDWILCMLTVCVCVYNVFACLFDADHK
jgi:hypothetical protein